jgi:hypothetical protein
MATPDVFGGLGKSTGQDVAAERREVMLLQTSKIG